MHRAETEANYDRYFVRIAEIGDATDMPPESLDEAFRPDNGLIATWPAGAVLLAGSQLGVMTIALEAWDSQPPGPTPEWEDVRETTYDSLTGTVYVLDVWGTTRPTPDELLTLPRGPGRYSVRAHARGRAAARRVFGSADHAETMLLQFWPLTIRSQPYGATA